VKRETLTRLNTAIAARRPVVLATDFQGGNEALYFASHPAPDFLVNALAEAFRSGKSTLVDGPNGRYFLTVHIPPVRLVVTGAVHISQALAEMARPLGLDLTIIDPRTAFATQERFPEVRVLAEWPDDALPALGLDTFTAFLALTHDPKIDDPGLYAALNAGCFYIGALGSRKTHARRVERLQSRGFSEAQIARIHAPIGLDIGAVSPAEIAVSILAEMIGAMRTRRRD
jgi:xanthine dehydrogenase accessory factor